MQLSCNAEGKALGLELKVNFSEPDQVTWSLSLSVLFHKMEIKVFLF